VRDSNTYNSPNCPSAARLTLPQTRINTLSSNPAIVVVFNVVLSICEFLNFSHFSQLNRSSDSAVLGASLRLFNWRVQKGETRGVVIRPR